MKLHNVPNQTWVRVLPSTAKGRVPVAAPPIDDDDLIFFGHIDGMYSYCTNRKGQLVHLIAWADVEIVEAPTDEP